MAFDANESGTETGQPIELYEFLIGATRTRLTSSENTVTVPSVLETYTPEAISRGVIEAELSSATGDKISVTLPTSNDFVTQFRSIAPGQKATLTIYRMHRADLGSGDDRVTIFKGTVRSVSFTKEGREAVLRVLPITSAYSRSIPRRTFQGPCTHFLFDSQCGLSAENPALKLTGGLVTDVTGDTITVTGAAAFNVLTDFFVAGYVESAADFRTIVAQSGDVLTLTAPFLVSPIGTNVDVRAGCKLRFQTDCIDKFSNGDNYGGSPWVPKKNPFQTGLD